MIRLLKTALCLLIAGLALTNCAKDDTLHESPSQPSNAVDSVVVAPDTLVSDEEVRTDRMRICIVHSETSFSVEFEGKDLCGTVDWGDGQRDSIPASHTYTQEGTPTVTYDMQGVTRFRIPALNSISAIEIYTCEEPDSL